MLVRIAQIDASDDTPANERAAKVAYSLDALPNADLIVLPEMWANGFHNFNNYTGIADGSSEFDLEAWAMERSSKNTGLLHAGTAPIRATAGEISGIYNRTLLARNGSVVAHYDKNHPFDIEGDEARIISPGSVRLVYSLQNYQLVFLTCYDIRFFHEWKKLLTRDSLVVVAAAWPAARRNDWTEILRRIAQDNEVPVIAANCTGKSPNADYAGLSMAIGPDGSVICEASQTDEEIFDVCI